MSWFLLAVVSTVMFGIQTFLYKSSAERQCNKFVVALAFLTTQAAAALVIFLVSGAGAVNVPFTFILAGFLGLIYFVKVISDLKAMECMPANRLVPIVSSNIIVVIAYGLVLFNETLSWLQIAGTIIVIASVILINIQPSKLLNKNILKIGLLFAVVSLLGGAGTRIINKYAAVGTSPEFFNLIAQLFMVFASLATFAVISRKNDEQTTQKCFKESIKLGILTGIVGSAAYITYLYALKTGPLSIVSTVQTLSTIVTITLAWLIYKEEMTRKHFFLIMMSVIGVILLRI